MILCVVTFGCVCYNDYVNRLCKPKYGLGLVILNISLRWPVVIITFLLTFSLMYAANYWRQQNLVLEPLREQLLAVESVEDVHIEAGGAKEITVSLGNVSQFAEAYRELQSILKTRNEAVERLTVLDRRNSYLESVYGKIHFALMEGERQGNYTQMSKEIKLLLDGEDGLHSYSLSVDQEAIYLQMRADDYYLYEVIPIKNGRLVWENANARI